ncbi:MAG TPA: hypothetical protein DDZ81_13105 [Acetobacteraceae bacterium]|nr:hypothetical protein [Acetobacteraceae bacterium]
MLRLLVLLAVLLSAPAVASGDVVLPSVEFTATAVHQAGAFESKETIHYADGKLRIDRGSGFSSTILDFTTQSQCLLMVNHTYLVMPMDNELFRRYVARPVEITNAHKLKTERIEGLETTKYAVGPDGALDAAGSYWLTKTGVMVRREYEDGVFGHNVHHLEFLTNISFEKQPAALFAIPAGYKPAK